MDRVTFKDAKVPVLSNVEPVPATGQQELKKRLIQQMTGSVRWREIMLEFSNLEITNIIEVGPGKALCGLLKRTCPEIKLETVGTLEQLSAKAMALVS